MDTLIATIEASHKLVIGPPSLIKVNTDGVSLTVLQNCEPFGIWIERDTKIGFADEMNEQDTMEKIDYKFINEMTKPNKSKLLQSVKTNQQNGQLKPNMNMWKN